jgi:hypothetical protein
MGRDKARQFFEKIFTNVQAMPKPPFYIPAGESAIAIGRLQGRARKSGKEIDPALAQAWKIPDGRVVRFEECVDTPAMLAALTA